MSVRRRGAALLLATLLLGGCAALGALGSALQAPRFAVAPGRSAELRLLGPSLSRPLGGAEVRLWASVSNPNPFGLTLAGLAGALSLQNTQAAEVNFPLGVPLPAAGDTIIPLDIAISFANLPALAELLPRAVGQGSVPYRLHGSFQVDAGPLGRPSFGPMTLLEGSIQTRR